MNSTKVTVGIISYNHAEYLPFTIESVLAQTYHNIEIVIVDDGSNDESLQIAQKYAQKHSQISVYTHPNNINKGISATCNLAIEKSSGNYIALLGSDDAFYPDTIEEQVNLLGDSEEVGIVCGIAEHINQFGEMLNEKSGQDIWSSPNYFEQMVLRNRITAPTVMVRRACYETVGGYNLNVINNDYEMWLRILTFTDWRVGFINKPLALYRRHSTNVSLNQSNLVNLERSLLVLREIEKQCVKNKCFSEKYRLIKNEIGKKELKLFRLNLSLYAYANPVKIFNANKVAKGISTISKSLRRINKFETEVK
jgi:glycosyltransferase involved in cell wall biosynthesis